MLKMITFKNLVPVKELLLILVLSPFLAFSETEITPLDFDIIPMHYEALKGQPYIWDPADKDVKTKEIKFELAFDVEVGSTEIELIKHPNNKHLKKFMLIVYSTSESYHIAQIKSVNKNIVTFVEPLEAGVSKDDFLWNFYNDGAHPNKYGYYALADFTLNQLDTASLENKTHVFIGDSWFEDHAPKGSPFEERVLGQIDLLDSINKAIGGRTSKDVLDQFDEDLSNLSVTPDFVWLIVGTNDYWNLPDAVTSDVFIQNVEAIIRKINDLGAKAIVIDSSVAGLDGDSVVRQEVSHDYANKLAQLYLDNKPVTPYPDPKGEVEPKSSGGTFFLLDLLLAMALFLRRRLLASKISA